MYCKYCGTKLEDGAKFCYKCGASQEDVKVDYDFSDHSTNNSYGQNNVYSSDNRSRIVAGVLALFLGGVGIHKIYCGKMGMFILYLLFSWTGIPELVGIIEGIIYLICPTDAEFRAKYCN